MLFSTEADVYIHRIGSSVLNMIVILGAHAMWLEIVFWLLIQSERLHNTPEFHYSAFKSQQQVANVQHISIQWWLLAGRQVLMILWGLTYLFIDSLQPNFSPTSKCIMMGHPIFIRFWCTFTVYQAWCADRKCHIKSSSSFYNEDFIVQMYVEKKTWWYLWRRYW